MFRSHFKILALLPWYSKNSKGPHHRFTPAIECLEDRKMLSADMGHVAAAASPIEDSDVDCSVPSLAAQSSVELRDTAAATRAVAVDIVFSGEDVTQSVPDPTGLDLPFPPPPP